MTGTVTFRSKVDAWLAGIVLFAVAAMIWSMAVALREDPAEASLPAAVAAIVLLLVGALTVPVRYVLTERELIIRSGLLRSTIPLERIRSVRPTHSLLASPAWSLDRLEIDHGGRGLWGLALISPAEKSTFLELLQARAGLTPSGTKLVRADRSGG